VRLVRVLLSVCLFTLAGPLGAQRLTVRAAPPVAIPLKTDGNSPSFWRDGEFHFMTSDGKPLIAGGPSQLQFSWVAPAAVETARGSLWFESAWVDSDGTVYAWYHHEPEGLCRGSLTAPEIGAAVSYDSGRTFFDLGVILTSGDPVDCSARNGFFAGGHGDFSVVLDREASYFYFFFTNYGGPVAGQGVAAARLAFEDGRNPAGVAWKYFEGAWTEPGLGGRVTPVFPTRVAWQRSDADSYWGPAIHWNTHLESYVVLMNRACCAPGWPQDGIHASFNADLGDPRGWSPPEEILWHIGFAPGFYPQVMGMGPGETDTLAGQRARLFIQGRGSSLAATRRSPA